MGFFATVVVGLIAGWLVSIVLKTRLALWKDLLMGVIGGFVGGWLTSVFLGQNLMSGINLTSVLVAAVGAIIVILLYRVVARPKG